MHTFRSLFISLLLIIITSVIIKAQAPTITGATVNSDNTYITISFNQGIYTNAAHTLPVTVGDFTFNFVQNGGNATVTSISAVTRTNGNPLLGNESSIRAYLAITGDPSGVETVEITPFDGSSIYNIFGNPMVLLLLDLFLG